MSADVEAVGRAVARVMSRRREVLAAYLFGSVARGRVRKDSDVDVAVLIDEARVPARRRLRYRLDLMSDLGGALRRSDVDVVILNDAPPLVAHRVLSQGRMVFERSAAARVRFQVRTAGRYFDLVPAFEVHLRYLKEHARRGQARG